MNNEVKFSEEAEHIIELINNSKENLFITGKAGTGKSTLLKYVNEQNASFIVLAPTGIAAINVNGDTIHSFFKLKPGYELDEAKHVRINNKMISEYAKVHTIIIDEISMVRADVLDAIDVFLQRIRGNNYSFGGVRMIFFGDLFQLPPVLLNNERNEFLKRYKSPYFFSAHAFIQKDLFSEPFKLHKYELKIIYRQKDPVFTELLNALRVNKISHDQLNVLNKQVSIAIDNDNDFLINLVATNRIAKNINLRKLQTINSSESIFKSVSRGEIENLKPNDDTIYLKVNAQVIFLNNDSEKRWVNGTIGKVVKIVEFTGEENGEKHQIVEVMLENGKTVQVLPFTWEISKYVFKAGNFVRETIGAFTQIPLKLAWAITIHKSQGKTFSKVRIDLGNGSFAHGQTYVALSRCKTLHNISLAKPIYDSDIIVDTTVLDFFDKQ